MHWNTSSFGYRTYQSQFLDWKENERTLYIVVVGRLHCVATKERWMQKNKRKEATRSKPVEDVQYLIGTQTKTDYYYCIRLSNQFVSSSVLYTIRIQRLKCTPIDPMKRKRITKIAKLQIKRPCTFKINELQRKCGKRGKQIKANIVRN